MLRWDGGRGRRGRRAEEKEGLEKEGDEGGVFEMEHIVPPPPARVHDQGV